MSSHDRAIEKLFKKLLTLPHPFETLRLHTEQTNKKMRTKTLLLIAAVAAAGISASQAQVYSVNAVGYVNKTVKANSFALLSNPLIAETNTVAALLAGQVLDQTQVFVWNSTKKSFDFAQFDATFGWDPVDVANTVINPGSGFFVKNQNKTTDMPITFVGSVPTGSPLHTALVPGFQLVSSQVPQAGTLEALGYQAVAGDTLYQWNGNGYDFFSFDPAFGWDPALKSIDVGDAVFLSKTTAGSWDRTFQVNQ